MSIQETTVTPVAGGEAPRKDQVTPLLYFIGERERIRIRRANGEPPPWTDDPILREWSFCNVRREDDRVTRWIAEDWRVPHVDDPDLWFAMVIARFVNWPAHARVARISRAVGPRALSRCPECTQAAW